MFYLCVPDAEVRLVELVKEGKVTEDAAIEIRQMLSNIEEASYDHGYCHGAEGSDD